jgi:hypothetical protein
MKILFGLIVLLSLGTAKADVVCSGNTAFGVAKVVVSNQGDKVTVTGAGLENPQIFTNLTQKHGIITAPGLAVFFENEYGCLRDATIITAFSHDVGDDSGDAGYVDTMRVAVCSGGTTPDRICGLK